MHDVVYFCCIKLPTLFYMKKNIAIAFGLVIVIPLASYFLMNYASKKAVQMPQHYIFDSVVTKVENGRQITDTVWHTVANIRLINQLGDTVNLYDIQGKTIVADFFFTSCGSICPTLTRNMAKLQQSFLKGGDTRQKPDTSIVHFLSFSIDPERDSVQRLKEYADKYHVVHDNWWFLTGPKDSIYQFAFEQLKVDKFSDEPIDPNFVHTSRFVLLDKHYNIRGYYNGLDSASLTKLAQDIGLLMLEKGTEPGVLPFEPSTLLLFFIITALAVILLIWWMNKKATPRKAQ